MAANTASFPNNESLDVDPSSSFQHQISSLPQSSRDQTYLGPYTGSNMNEHMILGQPSPVSPLGQSMEQSHLSQDYHEEATAFHSNAQYGGVTLSRSSSRASISRGNTLRKKKSLSRKSSLKRSSSKKSISAGSIGGLPHGTAGVDTTSIFYTPVPTSASPTDILANRFQSWRKLLKDLISYFREIQSAYEQRAKGFSKVSGVINNLSVPPSFLAHGGLGDALEILRMHHKQAALETSKARELENDVISQLNGLRSDLSQKIREIKSLSGDFKNSVEKEKENTKKLLGTYQDSLTAADADAKPMVGKEDPFIIKLAVERQVEKQIDEENYLHRAYLNLESSGRELEAIIVGEIQKAINAFGAILSKEAEGSDETVERLRSGPLSMPKDLEWSEFIRKDPNFITPDVPLRKFENIEYPGRHHPAATEVRAGMLERKSKYLKSYTPGWFVLSPTHLHEFKSADAVYSQAPAVSLYLPDQKLGAHSQPTSSSHKFILKGRQTGGMHRGHSWVFRAESYDTMLAWYDDLKSLTEKTGQERNEFIRGHNRIVSTNSTRSVSSLEEDEADQVPFSRENLIANGERRPSEINDGRPQPGGRFPSSVDYTSQKSRRSPSEESEVEHDQNRTATEYPHQNQFTPVVIPTEDHHMQTANIDHYDHQINQVPAYPPETTAQPGSFGHSNFATEQNQLNQAPQLPPVHTGGSLVNNSFLTEEETLNSVGFSHPINHDVPEKQLSETMPQQEPAEFVPLKSTKPQEDYNTQSVERGVAEPNAEILHNTNQDPQAKGPIKSVPEISRMDTDKSVSNLHLPGKYPGAI